MKRLTEKQQWWLISVIILAGGAFIFYYSFYKPLDKEIKRLKGEKAEKEATLLQNRKEAARLPYVEAESRRLKVELSYAEKVLPKDLDVPYILKTLTDLAFKNNVYFSSFNPGGIEEKGDYAVYPISLPVVGTFHNVLRFICAIGNLPRLINVVDISMSSIGGGIPEEEKPFDTVSCPLRLEAYIYR